MGQVPRIAGPAFHKHVTLAADLTPQTILTNLICVRHLDSSCRGWASAATCALLCSLPQLPVWLKKSNRQVIDRVQRWLDAKEIKAVVDWSHNLLGHSADQVSHQDFASITPTRRLPPTSRPYRLRRC
jgi:hypothetical protein